MYTVKLNARELSLLIDAVLGKIERVTAAEGYVTGCPDAIEAIHKHYMELRDLNTKLCCMVEEG